MTLPHDHASGDEQTTPPQATGDSPEAHDADAGRPVIPERPEYGTPTFTAPGGYPPPPAYPADAYNQQPTYPADAYNQQPTYPADAYAPQPTYPAAGYASQSPYPADAYNQQAMYPGNTYAPQPPYPGAPGYVTVPPPKKSPALAIGFAIAALVVGLINIAVTGGLLALALNGQADDVAAALGLTLVFGGIGLILTLALTITALVLSIRRRHTPAIVISAIATLATITIGVLMVSTFAGGATRLGNTGGTASPPAASTDDGSSSDPTAISWDNGDAAGSTAPVVVWDGAAVPEWRTTEASETKLRARNSTTGCASAFDVTDARGTSGDDDDDSVAALIDNVDGADPAELYDDELSWEGPGDESGLTFVTAEVSDSDRMRLSGYRVLNASSSQVSFAVSCPTGTDASAASTALSAAYSELWDAVTISAK